MQKERDRDNVPKGINEKEGLLGRAGDCMPARQMTQLPGERKQNVSQNQPKEIPEGTNEQAERVLTSRKACSGKRILRGQGR